VPSTAADIAAWTPITSASQVFTISCNTAPLSAGAHDLYIGALDRVVGAVARARLLEPDSRVVRIEPERHGPVHFIAGHVQAGNDAVEIDDRARLIDRNQPRDGADLADDVDRGDGEAHVPVHASWNSQVDRVGPGVVVTVAGDAPSVSSASPLQTFTMRTSPSPASWKRQSW
jgi:hypothetical protein